MTAAASAAAGVDLTSHKKRADRAWAKHAEWEKVLRDAYDFVAPQRLSTRTKQTPSARVDRIFDNTGPVSHMRSAGKLQQDLFPPGEPFVMLEPGPAVAKLGMNVDEARAELERIMDIVNPVFLTGEWDQAVIEMLTDLLISTGFMMIVEGDSQNPVRFISASQDEVAIDGGPYNTVGGIFFKREWSLRSIKQTYPRGDFTKAFLDEAEADGETMKTLCQDVVWDDAQKRWKLYAYLEDDAQHCIHEKASRECPWLTPRYFRVPGQTNGFGPVLMAMPTIKTLNKAVELTLRTAALAMSGIYTRIDDGVFNPDTARIEPGAFWTVARNGGPTGPSIQKLEMSGDQQLGNLVLNDLRSQVHMTMNDQALPPDSQPARSASEIIERIKRLAQDHAGAFGRLTHEAVIPAIKRVIEILQDMGILQSKIKIDNLFVICRVISPLGSSFKAERAQTYFEWLQAAAAVGGPGIIHMITPLDEALCEIGRDLGVPAHLVNSDDVRKSLGN